MGFTPKAIFDKQLIVGNEPNMLKTPVHWRGELWDFDPGSGPRPRETAQDQPAGTSRWERARWARPSVDDPVWTAQQETGP